MAKGEPAFARAMYKLGDALDRFLGEVAQPALELAPQLATAVAPAAQSEAATSSTVHSGAAVPSTADSAPAFKAAAALTAARLTVNSAQTNDNGHSSPPGDGTTASAQTSNTVRSSGVTAPAATNGTLAKWQSATRTTSTSRGHRA